MERKTTPAKYARAGKRFNVYIMTPEGQYTFRNPESVFPIRQNVQLNIRRV